MQSYDDFRLIPRNQAISSPTCVDKRLVFGVLNKRLNEQVKRNIERFPDDFMFQLTKEEWNVLRSQIATAKTPEEKTIALLRSQFATTKDLSKIRTLPYAFTRNGIGMLSSVLGSKTAVAMNIRIMRAFTISQQIMESNALLFNRVFHRQAIMQTKIFSQHRFCVL